MLTTADYLGDLVNLRKALASNLAINPALVKASEDETFSTLVDKAVATIDEWNKITKNGTDFSYMFYGRKVVTVPDISWTSEGVNFDNMFAYSAGHSLVSVGNIDVRNGVNFRGMFRDNHKTTTIGMLDTRNGTIFTEMFYSCSVKSITGLNLSKATNTYRTFYAANSLRDLTIYGTIGIGIEIGSPVLTNESAKSVIRALVDYSNTDKTGKNTCAFNSAVKTRLIAEGNTSPNGNTWIDYMTDKGWKVG